MLTPPTLQNLPPDVREYISDRFNNHGLDPSQAFDCLIPPQIKDAGPEAIKEFMQSKDISHVYPVSDYPHLANDLSNVILEDANWNRARGAEVMSPMEYQRASIDNQMDADQIAARYAGVESEFSSPVATDMVATDLIESSDSLQIEDFAEIVEATEGINPIEVTTGGAIGGGMSYAIYQALKEFLSLEGARQRGEISNSEVVERVAKIAWEAAKTGAAVGAIFGIAVMIFGSWLLIPISILAPFAGIKMTYQLWQAFWSGLNEQQRRELIEKANEIGGKIAETFKELEAASKAS
jgi:hypothetical protein